MAEMKTRLEEEEQPGWGSDEIQIEGFENFF